MPIMTQKTHDQIAKNKIALDGKVDKVLGKDLSQNDFTDALKTVLSFLTASKSFDCDTAQDNIQVAFNRITALGIEEPTPPEKNTKSHRDIEVPKQTLANDPAQTLADNRLITVANAFSIELALKQFVYQHFMPLLDKDNPTMKLMVSDTGLAAQMQVISNSRAVATMEWLKSTQEFMFALMDKDTGAVKADFVIKPNGHAYILGKQIATTPEVEKTIREFRTTITQDIADHAKPTLAECKTTFKKLPHYDWLKDDDWYIKDTSGGKIVLIKYRTKAGATEADSGNFFYEVLTKAV